MNAAEFDLRLDLAIGAIVKEFASTRPTDRLAGFALCTDDDLSSLNCLLVGDQDLVAVTGPDLMYMPAEWPFSPKAKTLRFASRALFQRSESTTDFEAHVDDSFATLVAALQRARASGEIATDVFLVVLSTDPSDYLLELQTRAIERLNGPEVADGWRAFLARWT